MFESLTERLSHAFKKISGQSRLSADNIQQALSDVRLSLLEADVALPVVKSFIDQVKEKALGQEVLNHLNPSQAFIKVVNDELTHILGDERQPLNYKTEPPAVFLMVGLQGSGKTTSSAKLARLIKHDDKKKVMLASVDVYRPAAITQLEVLAEQLDVPFFKTTLTDPVAIAKAALQDAKKLFIDVLIIDTAGRLHIDQDMMSEVKTIHTAVKPIETLFVVDSMTGQDAANTAKAFHDTLALTGVILTKADGDARGGAALSVKHITGQPIKFIGLGEKIDALEPFYPERIASRILGMGDILSLIEQVEKRADEDANKKLADKIKKGRGFNLEDFREQLLQMNNMGGLTSMMSKMPGLPNLPKGAMNQVNDKAMNQTIAIINSMTPKERRIPKIIVGSRKARIAKGAGSTIPKVNQLLKQFEQMEKMMKKFSQPGGMQKLMRGMQGLPGMKGILPNK